MADVGFGATLHVNTATAATSGTALGEVITITFLNASREPIDCSSMDSTNRYREFLPGMIDPGEITVELNYENATNKSIILQQMITSVTNTYYWQVTLNDGTAGARTSYKSAGFVTQPGPINVPYDGKLTHSVTIKLTGQPTLATNS